jgi:hypothetical protein
MGLTKPSSLWLRYDWDNLLEPAPKVTELRKQVKTLTDSLDTLTTLLDAVLLEIP